MLHQLPCSHEHAFDTSARRHGPDPGTLRPHGGRHAEARRPAVDLLAVPFDERTSRHVAPPAWSGCPRHGGASALRYRTGILAPAPTVSVCARKARPRTRASSARTGLSKPNLARADRLLGSRRFQHSELAVAAFVGFRIVAAGEPSARLPLSHVADLMQQRGPATTEPLRCLGLRYTRCGGDPSSRTHDSSASGRGAGDPGAPRLECCFVPPRVRHLAMEPLARRKCRI